MALELTQSPAEMNNRNLSGDKERPAHKADNSNPFRELIV
jgi:hypothetical protein